MSWLLAIALAATYAPLREGRGTLPAEQEMKAEAVGKTIRCAVCQGLSVADSPSPMAQAMMDRVRDMVEEGKSEEEIRAYFVERYGEWILLEPKAEGLNLIVWLMPFLVLGIGFLIIGARTKKPSVAPTETNEDDEYLRAVRKAVDD